MVVENTGAKHVVTVKAQVQTGSLTEVCRQFVVVGIVSCSKDQSQVPEGNSKNQVKAINCMEGWKNCRFGLT